MRGIHSLRRCFDAHLIGWLVTAVVAALVVGPSFSTDPAWAGKPKGHGDPIPIASTQVARFQGLLAGKDPASSSSWTGGNLCGNTRSCYHELEEVPHRIVLKNLKPNGRYTITVLIDARDNAGHPGYDGIDSVVGFVNVAGGVGVVRNADTSAGCGASTTCRSYTFTFASTGSRAEIRFNAHLALGSHLYGGASLSARLLGVGARNVPIPVKRILFTAPIGIRIDKGGPARAHVGDTITYTLAVRLTTSQPLSDITVSDPRCDRGPSLVSKDGGDQDRWLEPGETWRYRCTRTVRAQDPDPLRNTATVTGTSADGREASDRDAHLVDIIHPAIRIVKSADRAWVTPGQTIAYTYVTRNIGDTTLFGVVVTDDKLGHICSVPHPLRRGASYTCTARFEVPLRTGPIDNVGTAVGHDVLGRSVTDQDTVSVAVILGTTVTPPPTVTPPSGLAFTGPGRVAPRALLALLLLVSGIGLLVSTRRQRGPADV